MTDEARKATRTQYDDTIQKLKLCHQGLFPLFELRKKMLRAMEDEHEVHKKKTPGSSKNAQKSQKQKGKGKGTSSVSEQSKEEEANKSDEEEDRSESREDSSDEDDTGHNRSALEYIELSIDKQRKLDQKLRERLEVLYVALSTNWKFAKKAQTLQQGDKGKTLLERTVKAMSEEAKRKKDGSDSPNKRRRLSYTEEEFRNKGQRGQGGRGGLGARRGGYGPYDSRGFYGSHGHQGLSGGHFGQFGEGYR